MSLLFRGSSRRSSPLDSPSGRSDTYSQSSYSGRETPTRTSADVRLESPWSTQVLRTTTNMRAWTENSTGVEVLADTEGEDYVSVISQVGMDATLLIDYFNGRECRFSLYERRQWTKGVGVANSPMSLSELSKRFGLPISTAAASSAPMLRFLPVESAGDIRLNHDLALYAGVLLISKVCVFTIRSCESKFQFLNFLRQLAIASGILEGRWVDCRNSRLFGHLDIVMLDYPESEHDSSGMSRRDAYRQYFLEAESGTDSEVLERNWTREMIRNSFESVEIFFLTASSKHHVNRDNVPPNAVEMLLGNDLPRLAKNICRQLLAPSTAPVQFGSGGTRSFSGVSALAVLQHMLERVFQSGEETLVRSQDIVASICACMAKRGLQVVDSFLQEKMLELSNNLPMAKRKFEKHMSSIFEEMRQVLLTKGPRNRGDSLVLLYEKLLGAAPQTTWNRWENLASQRNKAARLLAVLSSQQHCMDSVDALFQQHMDREAAASRGRHSHHHHHHHYLASQELIHDIADHVFTQLHPSVAKDLEWLLEDDAEAYERHVEFLVLAVEEMVACYNLQCVHQEITLITTTMNKNNNNNNNNMQKQEHTEELERNEGAQEDIQELLGEIDDLVRIFRDDYRQAKVQVAATVRETLLELTENMEAVEYEFTENWKKMEKIAAENKIFLEERFVATRYILDRALQLLSSSVYIDVLGLQDRVVCGKPCRGHGVGCGRRCNIHKRSFYRGGQALQDGTISPRGGTWT